MLKNADIQIRDPFVVPVQSEGKYHLFGSTDKNIWGRGTGFDTYVSMDLVNWEGPFAVFRPDGNFWADENFWAPEVHIYNNLYYMFATFKRRNAFKGTAILVSNNLLGPFVPHSSGPVTPENWECLDGTLYVDDEVHPWIIFCHEWAQVHDGEICAMRLTEDLKSAVGEPVLLFHASDAPWVRCINKGNKEGRDNFVTDGPSIYKTADGELLMLWSSFVEGNIYAIGVARSQTGRITGPWVHYKEPLYRNDAGHGMLFKTFDNRLILTVHTPNRTPDERPIFLDIREEDGSLALK